MGHPEGFLNKERFMTLENSTNLSSQTQITSIEDFFKNLNWVGVGLGILGTIVIFYFLVKEGKK